MRFAMLSALVCFAACKSQESPVAKNPEPAGDPCGDPAQFVRGLFAQYAEGVKPIEHEVIFDESTLALIKRDHDLAQGDLPWLDYDPICNCQDWDKVAVTEVRIGWEPMTTAAVTYSNAGKTFREDFTLRCTSAGWRVHDIVVLPERASLRDGLAKAIEQAATPR
jgi:hypothetical protein